MDTLHNINMVFELGDSPESFPFLYLFHLPTFITSHHWNIRTPNGDSKKKGEKEVFVLSSYLSVVLSLKVPEVPK